MAEGWLHWGVIRGDTNSFVDRGGLFWFSAESFIAILVSVLGCGFYIIFLVTLSVYLWDGNFIMVLRRLGGRRIYLLVTESEKLIAIISLPSKPNAQIFPSSNRPEIACPLITTGTATTSTMHTFHHRSLIQLCLWHTTHTRRPKIRFLSLNTFQTTQLLVSLFLPPRYQCCVRVLLLQQPLIQFCGNGFPGVV